MTLFRTLACVRGKTRDGGNPRARHGVLCSEIRLRHGSCLVPQSGSGSAFCVHRAVDSEVLAYFVIIEGGHNSNGEGRVRMADTPAVKEVVVRHVFRTIMC